MAADVELEGMKEWLSAVVKIGAPSALLIFIIVWLTGDFNVRLRAIEMQHQEMTAHAARIEDLTRRTYMATERVFFVLQQICLQSAKTQSDKRDCLGHEGGGR